MAYTLGADGKWTHSDSSSGSGKTKSTAKTSSSTAGTKKDTGNSAVSDKAIKETTKNKTTKTEYVETATAKVMGNPRLRKGAYVNIKSGVSQRWLGKWLILSATHTVDANGYTVDLELGRKPIEVSDGTTSSSGSGKSSTKSSSGSTKSSSSDGTKTATKAKSNSSSSSDKLWKLDTDGKWQETSKK